MTKKIKGVEIVVFSDLHAHQWSEGGVAVPHEGLTSDRLLSSVSVIRDIQDYCERNEIKIVIFLGDLFHDRMSVDKMTLSLVTDAIKNLASAIELLVLVPGNHDYPRDNVRDSVLSIFQGHVNIIVEDHESVASRIDQTGKDSFSVAVQSGTSHMQLHFRALPYHPPTDPNGDSNYPKIKKWLDNSERNTINLMHLGIAGVPYLNSRPDVIAEYKYQWIQKGDLPEHSLLNIMGDYHSHQKVNKNSFYVGAPMGMTWGDIDDKRGFCVIRITDPIKSNFLRADVKHISISPARVPYFLSVEEKQLRILTSDKIEEIHIVHVTMNSLESITGLQSSMDSSTPGWEKMGHFVMVKQNSGYIDSETFLDEIKKILSDSKLSRGFRIVREGGSLFSTGDFMSSHSIANLEKYTNVYKALNSNLQSILTSGDIPDGISPTRISNLFKRALKKRGEQSMS